jgi:predicted RNA-binding Zn ribbon-like protein
MQFNTYTAFGARIAADLVNSPDPADPELAAALDSYQVHETAVTPQMTAGLRSWAERLRPVFAARDPAEKADAVDALLVAAGCMPRLVSHDGLPHHLHYAPVESDLPGRVRALTAAGLAHLIADGEGHRLGQCHREGCSVVFVDTSRNGRRRFCSVRCANAVNVSRHRARRRAGSADAATVPSSRAAREPRAGANAGRAVRV